ncbi:hypothetical protein BDV96DRAFT_616069 [Lophiotrema nucula]|uniref:catechol O-methyltransferase n=1 Tax=Lophiotrema nucula TaxID=690887 RepID=A0A6A5YPS6_9PLEO|nr:hypothetical protein BDV96DRAFT_616069 [Lophiotrema nucula]
MAEFDQSKAYAPQEEGTSFFDDGREIELLHFMYEHPNLENLRGSPKNVLAAIDEYGRTKKYLMNVGEDKGRIVSDLIAEVKPKTMVELGGYVGYSCILFGDAARKAGGQRYYSLERNPEFAAVIASLVELAGLSNIVKVVVGSSDASIARLHANGDLKRIDLMFLDHYKPAYTTDLKLCEELAIVSVGSVLAADNVIKPGNPPYLEYVRSSVEEKRKRAQEEANGKAVHGEGIPDKTVNQYQKRVMEEKFSNSKGDPNLIYESRLVNSFEPTDHVAAMSSPTHQSSIPFFYRHVPKNVLLVLLSFITVPVSAFFVLASYILSYFRPSPKSSNGHNASRRKTILVTGISMTKGLTITRILTLHTPHCIIGADIEAIPFSSPGRYSRSVSSFHTLETPNGDNSEPYIDSLLSLMKKEKVDLWISCSSVIGALEDGEVVRLAERELGSDFRAVQFREDVVERLHEKDKFINYIRSIALPVPDSHRCETNAQVLDVFLKEDAMREYNVKDGRKKWIMKPIGVDDRARANMMTLLPLGSADETRKYIKTLNIGKENPYQMQHYISGPEYCTHALVLNGKVKSFVACPSSELLMHYKALPPTSSLARKMLDFTERVAEDGGASFSGHLSFDFLAEGEGESVRLYPIECNPRAHTAVVLFRESKAMADAYSYFASGRSGKKDITTPMMPSWNYYWAGHDLVTFVLIPLLEMLFGRGSLEELSIGLAEFWQHLVYWRDGTFVVWDPLPFFVLYHIYWPAQFVDCLLKGKEWSRINVSTTKVFQA